MKNKFLLEMKSRGYLNQCTDLAKLQEICDKQSISGYIGFDCTASSIHVGSLLQLMILKLLQKYDLIVSFLSLHYSNDVIGSLIQYKNFLNHEGSFLAILFGGETLMELKSCFIEADENLYGKVYPRIIFKDGTTTARAEARGRRRHSARAGLSRCL